MDPIYYDHPYYLIPSKGGEKAYQLLVEILHRANKTGLAKFVLGEREYLVAVSSIDGALSLITLHYSEDILPAEDIVPEAGSIPSSETISMKNVIKKMTADFNPDKHANERREKIMGLLKKMGKKQPPVAAPRIEEEEMQGPVDLVAALEASMRKVKKNR